MQIKNLFAAFICLFAALVCVSVRAEDVRIALYAEPNSMDPHYHNLGPNNGMMFNIFGRLITMDHEQNLVPDLAVSWKRLDDTTWEFKLREGVKFSDGSDFTADDVIFSINRASNYTGGAGSGFRHYVKGKTIEKVDDHTLLAKTSEPYPLMPNDLSAVHIVSSSTKGSGKPTENGGMTTEDFNTGKVTVGTAPYRFVSWSKGREIVIERNPNYYGKPALWDKVTFVPIPSNPARVAALLAGDVDVIDFVPPTDLAKLRKNPKVKVHSGPSLRTIYFGMDQFRDVSPFVTDLDGKPLKKNPFNDVRVRKAISKMINRDAIVERIMEGAAIPAGNVLPDGAFGVSPRLKPEKYDPEGAKKLLKEAGYPNGFALTIHGPNNRYVNDAKICEAVAQMLARAGIRTKVETMPKNVFFTRASRGGKNKMPEFSMFLLGISSSTGESSVPLKLLLATYDKAKGRGRANRSRYSNSKVDELIEVGLTMIDDEKRREIFERAFDVALGEDQAVIPLHHQVISIATRPGLVYRPRRDERMVAWDLLKEE